MFTGIVQAIGEITSVIPQSQIAPEKASEYSDAQGVRLGIGWGSLDASDVRVGDSIAINGACMTVLAPGPDGFAVDVSRESLARTVGLSHPGPVNLEKAMRLGDRLGGHMVSGHVDATGLVVSVQQVDESVRLVVELPTALSPYVTEKGSIAIHGVSLTVNHVRDLSTGSQVDINLIPHTWRHTVLQFLKAGDQVNIEVDPIARQVARVLQAWRDAGQPFEGVGR
jgi:riboflavin synthase